MLMLVFVGIFITLIKIIWLTVVWVILALNSGSKGFLTPFNMPVLVIAALIAFASVQSYANKYIKEENTSELSAKEVAAELLEFKAQLDTSDYSYIHVMQVLGADNFPVKDGSHTVSVSHKGADNSCKIVIMANNAAEYAEEIKSGLYLLEPGEYTIKGGSFTFDDNYSGFDTSPASDAQKLAQLKKTDG